MKSKNIRVSMEFADYMEVCRKNLEHDLGTKLSDSELSKYIHKKLITKEENDARKKKDKIFEI